MDFHETLDWETVERILDLLGFICCVPIDASISGVEITKDIRAVVVQFCRAY